MPSAKLAAWNFKLQNGRSVWTRLGGVGVVVSPPSHFFLPPCPTALIILSVYRKEDGYYGTRVDRSDRTHDDLVQPQDHHPRGGLERGDQEEGEFQSVPARFRPARIGMGACIFWSRVMGGK